LDIPLETGLIAVAFSVRIDGSGAIPCKDPTDLEGKLRLYAKTTAIRRLTVVRRLCAEAVFKGLVAENPTEGVRGLRNAAPEETPHQALTMKQLHALLDAIGTRTLKDLRNKALLTVLARLGLR
jgi:site-specific recombinase XerD